MARGNVPQAEALFDVTADGDFVVAADVAAEVHAEPEHDLRDPDVWQADLEQRLSQEDRAIIAVMPNQVDIADRAGHLSLALDEIALGNRDRGFAAAAQKPAHRDRIEAWGGPRTDDVAGELAYRGLTHERRARYEFFAASGVGRLALATAQTELSGHERVARRYMDERWGDFQKQYGGTGPAVRKQRAAYQDRLAEQINSRDNKD